ALLGFNYNSLWRDSRFSGYDRLGDANQLSLGVTSRLLEEDGFERARFGVGQILYFSNRQLWINPTAGTRPGDDKNWDENLNDAEKKLLSEMQNRASPLASELVYNINRVMSIRQDLIWDTNENEIDDYGLYYTYKPDSRRVLNIGYRYRDQVDRYVKDAENHNIPDPNNPGGYLTTENNLRQTDISFAWPVYNRWSAMGRWQYDITTKRNLEIMSGVEYNSCCYQVRLLWRNWIEDGSNIDHPDTKSGVFLQFVLRGLGNIATGSAKEYLEGIKGYTADEK
ncbi:MAG: LPS-assembly protein LptD, partial [Endozoicomonas sp.]